MRIDAGWQQLLPLLRSAGKTAVQDNQAAAGDLTNTAAGQPPAGTTSVELAGTAMIRQLLNLAENLSAGANLLPADTPAAIKEQVSALLAQGAAKPAQLPQGLAPLAAEQRAVPQRLNQLAEQALLAKTLAEAAVAAEQPQRFGETAPAAPKMPAPAATAGALPSPEAEARAFSPQALRRFITQLAGAEQPLPASDAAVPEGEMSAAKQLPATADGRLQAVEQENDAVARFVAKVVAELKQGLIDRGLPAAEAEAKAWEELALAGRLMEQEPAKLLAWSSAIKELANTWARFAQGGAEPASGRELQMSWMLPFVDPEQGKVRPALIQVYRDRPEGREAGEQRAETWIRIATETDNAGLVIAGFHQQGERLQVRVSVEKAEGAAFFREQLSDIRQRLHEIWPESGVDVQ